MNESKPFNIYTYRNKNNFTLNKMIVCCILALFILFLVKFIEMNYYFYEVMQYTINISYFLHRYIIIYNTLIFKEFSYHVLQCSALLLFEVPWTYRYLAQWYFNQQHTVCLVFFFAFSVYDRFCAVVSFIYMNCIYYYALL